MKIYDSKQKVIDCSNEQQMVAEGLRLPAAIANPEVLVKSNIEREQLKEMKKDQNHKFKGVVLVPFDEIG